MSYFINIEKFINFIQHFFTQIVLILFIKSEFENYA